MTDRSRLPRSMMRLVREALPLKGRWLVVFVLGMMLAGECAREWYRCALRVYVVSSADGRSAPRKGVDCETWPMIPCVRYYHTLRIGALVFELRSSWCAGVPGGCYPCGRE